MCILIFLHYFLFLYKFGFLLIYIFFNYNLFGMTIASRILDHLQVCNPKIICNQNISKHGLWINIYKQNLLFIYEKL